MSPFEVASGCDVVEVRKNTQIFLSQEVLIREYLQQAKMQ